MREPTFSSNVQKLLEDEKYQIIADYAQPLAESGDSQAQFLLGYLYFTSADVSWPDSQKWLSKAAEQNHPDALYYLSVAPSDVSSESIAARNKLLRRAAELGCVHAQRDLGCLLCVGETDETGFQKDEVEGRKWYLKAARAGHADAQYNVGLMMLSGEGGDVDIAEGLNWLHKSASSDDYDPSSESAAQVLADIYENGYFDVPIDQEKASGMRKRAVDLDVAYKRKYGC